MRNNKRVALSVVVPCFNEEEVLGQTHERIRAALGNRDDVALEIIYVDEGSKDGTPEILARLGERDETVRVLHLSRNFGHQAAVSAGVAHASGDCVAIIDGDLQDPPEVILKMLDLWRAGSDVVYGERKARKESMSKRFAYFVFYRLWRISANIDIPLDSGDFCLMDRQVVDVLNALPEKVRFFRGLRAWSGFVQTALPYERAARAAGEPKYTFPKLLSLAWDGLFNFSVAPLRFISVIGLMTAFFSVLGLVLFVFLRAFNIEIFSIALRDVPGWTSLVFFILLLGGIQLTCLGILGEYIGRLYDEVKARPTYIVKTRRGFK